jgi:hypothetical protein
LELPFLIMLAEWLSTAGLNYKTKTNSKVFPEKLSLYF